MIAFAKFRPLDLPLDAGSLSPVSSGGADGGGEPAPAPSPGGDVSAAAIMALLLGRKSK